jgi:hypothetical protein
MWRAGGGSTDGSGGCFNVLVMGVEGKRRGMPLPEGEEEEASSSRWWWCAASQQATTTCLDVGVERRWAGLAN